MWGMVLRYIEGGIWKQPGSTKEHIGFVYNLRSKSDHHNGMWSWGWGVPEIEMMGLEVRKGRARTSTPFKR